MVIRNFLIAFLAIFLSFLSIDPAISQCADDVPFISFEPEGPSSESMIRIVVSREYPNGCSGLQDKSIVEVDTANARVVLEFDQFCFDSTNCSQAVHCDTAHYIIEGIPAGDYMIVVVDNNDGNNSCDTIDHEPVLDSLPLAVKDISLVGSTVYGSQGSTQCVPFVVSGFNTLIDMQVSFKWDSNVVRFNSVRNLYPLEYFLPFNLFSPRANELRMIWVDEDITGKSIPDDVILFEACFDLVGMDGDTAVIDFTQGVLEAKASDGSDPDGPSFSMLTENGVIIIDEDRFGTCSMDSVEILCSDWVIDTLQELIREQCVDSSNLALDLISWRGYEILRLTTSRVQPSTDLVGQEDYYTCEGELIGSCTFAGRNRMCDALINDDDITEVRSIWECGDRLPGCYLTSASDEKAEYSPILLNNMTKDRLVFKKPLTSKAHIVATSGKILLSLTAGSQEADLSTFSPGVYWLRTTGGSEAFVIVP